VRELETIDAAYPEALAAYMTEWGFLRQWREGGPFWKPGSIPVVPLDDAQEEVRAYQGAVSDFRKVKGLRNKEIREKGERDLREFIAKKLSWNGATNRDPEDMRLTLIESPLGAAWQHLAECYAAGRVPYPCEECERVVTRMATDRRPDRTNRFCGDGCRTDFHNRAKAENRKKAARQKPRRRRKKT
jgi:hypothetical protein